MQETIKRIGVTGGRNYRNKKKVWEVMNQAKSILGDRMFVVVGCAPGLDRYVRWWCDENLLPHQWKTYYADWDELGNYAGHERNTRMAQFGLDMLISFPGGVGTANMIEQVEGLNTVLHKTQHMEITE